MTYRAVYPWATIEVPRRFRTHSVAKDGAHVCALAQFTKHASHRRASQTLLIRSIRQERRPRADTAYARR